MGVAWVEVSTGRFVAAAFPRRQLADQLARIAPAECLVAEDAEPLPQNPAGQMMVTRRPPWAFAAGTLCETLAKHFGTAGLDGFGFADTAEDQQAICAAGEILHYLGETQKTSLAHIDRLTPYRAAGALEIDEASRRSLEITRTIRGGRRNARSWVLDQTVTGMGLRPLADWLASPLADAAAIQPRLDCVQESAAEPAACRRPSRDAPPGPFCSADNAGSCEGQCRLRCDLFGEAGPSAKRGMHQYAPQKGPSGWVGHSIPTKKESTVWSQHFSACVASDRP